MTKYPNTQGMTKYASTPQPEGQLADERRQRSEAEWQLPKE